MLIWDLESDGLLDTVTKVHCIAIHDTEIGSSTLYGPKAIPIAIGLLRKADCMCGHNIIGYDIPVLKKLFGFDYAGEVVDTMILSRLTHRDLIVQDSKRCRVGVNPGGHRLEDWGVRMGILKGKYGATTDWQEYTEEMGEYCLQDVTVTKALYEYAIKKTTPQAVKLEMDFATIISRQERYGFPFHTDKAELLYSNLCVRQKELEGSMRETFGTGWMKQLPDLIPKRDNKTRGYLKGVPVKKEKWVEFNPGSRDHLAKLMMERGWKPPKFTEGGKSGKKKPQVDEKTIKTFKGPEAPLIVEFLDASKRISMVATGKQAWLKKVNDDGRMYGRCISNGTVTGRCSHNGPNLGQVPAEGNFRSLFYPGEGRVQCGADAQAVQARMLAHYMGDEEYTNLIITEDIHSVNQKIAGLPTRDGAKTFYYALLFGAGDAKIGNIVGGKAKEGRDLKALFFDRLPALGKLMGNLTKAAGRGYIKALDGSRIPIRSPHSALNFLLQGGEATVMKKAIAVLDAELRLRHWTPGNEYEFLANVHDEWQASCLNEEVAHQFGKESVTAIQVAGMIFKLRCPLDGAYKIGNSWAQTH